VLDSGQVVRVERDAATATRLSGEEWGSWRTVWEFDVAPGEAMLALVAGLDGERLVLADRDGKYLRMLDNTGPARPRISPDGSQIAVQMYRGGVYLLPSAGGDPVLIQASEMTSGGKSLRRFTPVAWSPDSARLLLIADIYEVDGAYDTLVMDLASRARVWLSPSGLRSVCGGGTWSADGSFIMVTLCEWEDAFPGLWRADPVTGAVAPLLPAELDGAAAYYAEPWQLPNGDIMAFVAQTSEGEQSSGSYRSLAYTMARIPAGTQQVQTLRHDAYQLYDARWAPDGSGAVVLASAGGEDPDATALLWLPVDGGDAIRLPLRAPWAVRWGALSSQ
jgi:Tol biopolymer transport system component